MARAAGRAWNPGDSKLRGLPAEPELHGNVDNMPDADKRQIPAVWSAPPMAKLEAKSMAEPSLCCEDPGNAGTSNSGEFRHFSVATGCTNRLHQSL